MLILTIRTDKPDAEIGLYRLDLRKARSSPDLSNSAANDFSSLDVSSDTSLSDKTVFARVISPWKRTILRKSSQDTKKLAYETWHAHRNLSVTIHQKIQDLLNVKGLTFHKIEGIVCFKGPGSFTGLRIGISVANALAYGLSVPIVSTTGKDWQTDGIARLNNNENETVVIPEYGSEPHTTKPRK